MSAVLGGKSAETSASGTSRMVSREPRAGEKPRPRRDLRIPARMAGLLSAGAAGVKRKAGLKKFSKLVLEQEEKAKCL